MTDRLAQFAFLLIVAAIVYSLVRPGSKAGQAVQAVTDALVGVIGTTTGYTQRG